MLWAKKAPLGQIDAVLIRYTNDWTQLAENRKPRFSVRDESAPGQNRR